MKILPCLLLVLAGAAPLHAGIPEMIAEVRRAGQQFGFGALHHVRMSYGVGGKTVYVEDFWLDLKTGAFKLVSSTAETKEGNPLASGESPPNSPRSAANGIPTTAQPSSLWILPAS